MEDGSECPGSGSRRALLAALASAGSGSLAGCAGSDSGDGGPRIDVPDEARIDRPVEPTIEGLDPAERVTVTAETTEPGSDRVWTAEATFEADGDGRVDLAADAPVEGDYEGVDPMGPFWAMETDELRRRALFPLAGHDVDLAVRREGADERVAETTTARTLEEHGSEPFVDDVVGTIYLPEGADPAPAVVLLHGAGGSPPDPTARLFADRGYVAGSVQYFGSPEPIPDALAEVPVEYVERVVDQLLAHDRVAGESVGVYGRSRGGEFALLAGSHVERIGAVASVVGSGLVWEGISANRRLAGTSSWSVDGEPVPYATWPEDVDPGSFEIASPPLRTLEEERIEAATIPLEGTDAPILAVSGADDRLWRGADYTTAALDRLDEQSVDFEYDHVVYEDAGHAILPPYRPSFGTTVNGNNSFGGTPADNAAAAADHWPQVLEFFERSLDG